MVGGAVRRQSTTLGLIFAIAMLLNFGWEMAQGYLYRMPGNKLPSWLHCLRASAWDAFATVAIIGTAMLFFRRRDSNRPSIAQYTCIAVMGTAVGISIELIATHVLHRWSYAPGMPLFPVLQVAALPALQMLILPMATFAVATTIARRLRQPSLPLTILVIALAFIGCRAEPLRRWMSCRLMFTSNSTYCSALEGGIR